MNFLTKYKAQKLEAMHNMMIYIDDEDYYYTWINLIPDRATKEDFIKIAEDEAFYKEAEEAFKKLITKAIARNEF